jgi:hypothetical protein
MRIRHPFSFILLFIVTVSLASLSVVWTFAHMVTLGAMLTLNWFVRYVAHHEGKNDFGREPVWRRWG